MPQTELIKAMQDARFYPQPEQSVDFIQTHISCLFLTSRDVYKLKKPVNLGFLDFSTLDKRLFYCQEEVRLNTRLAPTVYQGVLPVSQNNSGQFFLGQQEDARIVDYVVHMRRLSEDSMFPVLLRQGRVDEHLLQELADLLADFHAQARAVPRESELGSLSLIRRNIEENFEQTEMLKNRAISARRHRVMRQVMLWSLNRQQDLYSLRHARGKTRECHGDLRMEHLCLFEGQLIAFDCIEFNERFRFIDTAADLSFLLMDMEFHGYWKQADTLLYAYVHSSGDHDLLLVVNMYKAYYALTRGKVFGIESTEQEFSPQERRQALDMSSKFLDLAWSYAVKLQTPALIILCGLMGTGKSEVARSLSRQLGAEVLRSDVVRKALHGLDPQQKQLNDYGQGLYSGEATQATYQALGEQAGELLKQGRSVILDASFGRREHRELACALAKELNLRCILLECVCPDDVLVQRLEKRLATSADASDGRTSLLKSQKADFQPVTELDPSQHVVLDTAHDLEQVEELAVEAVLEALRRQEYT
ncbi:MAG: AAA family ATPase [Desulfovermiculus sp.]